MIFEIVVSKIPNYHFEIVVSELSNCYVVVLRECIFIGVCVCLELMIGTIVPELRFLIMRINESADVTYFTSLFYYFVSLINLISHENQSNIENSNKHSLGSEQLFERSTV